MSSTALEFWRLVGEGIALSFGRAAKFEYTSESSGWFILAGEPFVDFNCALVAPGPSAEKAIETAVRRFRAAGVPFLVCVVGRDPKTAKKATKLGLSPAGPLPLMVYDQQAVPQEKPVQGLVVRQAHASSDYRLDAALAESCFGLPVASIGRVMPFDSDPDPRLRTLLAFLGGELVGSVSYSLQKGGIGIWSLKTRPDLRHQGIGWHVMQQTIKSIRSETQDPVFLVSTPSGKPLYERLGFRIIDTGVVWTFPIRT